jgi:leucine dehydrogenase
MKVLAALQQQGHEQVIAFRDAPSGLRGFLAIHSTALGPAFGGVRIIAYRSEDDALADALRLSRGMTYKCALAGLPAGGGKAVILDSPGLDRERGFEACGRLVESLGGRFFTGGDVGIRPEDLAHVRRSTRHVACESPALGDINEHTAMGVWHALRGCLEFLGIEPAGARVAIQSVVLTSGNPAGRSAAAGRWWAMA